MHRQRFQETWVLVQNPNAGQVSVDLSFMTSRGPAIGPQGFTIPAYSRRSFNVGDYVSDWGVLPKVTSTGGGVICERAMYGNGRQWAHDSIGTTSPSFAWFFAEGCTGGYMQTWILIQNPESYSQKTKVFLMSDEGPLGYIPFELPAYSRFSLNVADYVELYNVCDCLYSRREWRPDRYRPDRLRAGHVRLRAHLGTRLHRHSYPCIYFMDLARGQHCRGHGDLGAGAEPDKHRR